MQLKTRYQAAILKNDHVLMLKVKDRDTGHTFWLIPGGSQEQGETEEECVVREVREETHLQVKVDRLILDEPNDIEDGFYHRNKTYLCRIISGEAQPGIEPEVDDEDNETIQEIGWFDLRDPTTWHPLALSDPITYPRLQKLRSTLGYTS